MPGKNIKINKKTRCVTGQSNLLMETRTLLIQVDADIKLFTSSSYTIILYTTNILKCTVLLNNSCMNISIVFYVLA